MRAIEVIKTTGKPVHKIFLYSQEYENILQIGIEKSSGELKNLIKGRLEKRLRQPARIDGTKGVTGRGMISEVKKLHQDGLSWKRLEELGLEYRFIAQYLQDKISYEEMKQKIQKESEHFAKRQMTWFKRDKRIHWIHSQREAEDLIKKSR